jgi:hypothetical protein
MMLVTAAALVAAMLLPLGAAGAQQADTVVVEVGPTAKLIDDGDFVRVKVKVTCEPVDHVLESLLFVQQQDASGEGFISPVVCDGRTHVLMEEVEALSESPFHPGEASVSAFVLVCLDAECSETAQGQETRVVRVVGS